MSEIPVSTPQSAKRPRMKKMAIRIDFTPMVDLGFLLITFFMLTTVIAKPNVMPVVMPDYPLLPEANPPVVAASKVLTLLLGPGDKVYWYEGAEPTRLDSTDYAATGLRKVILNKKEAVRRQWGDEIAEDPKRPGALRAVSRMNVIIKPARNARYKNIVDALDEMKICGVARYMLLDISPVEKALLP